MFLIAPTFLKMCHHLIANILKNLRSEIARYVQGAFLNSLFIQNTLSLRNREYNALHLKVML